MTTINLLDYVNDYLTDALHSDPDYLRHLKTDTVMFLMDNALLRDKTIEAINFMKENNFGGPSDIIHDIIGLRSNDECFAPKVIKIDREQINYPSY